MEINPLAEKPRIERILTPEEIEYWKRVNDPKEKNLTEAIIVRTDTELLDLMKTRGEKYFNRFTTEKKDFEIDAANRPVILKLALYFLNDPRFCEMGENYSLDKGIILTSDKLGSGKTTLMKLFCRDKLWQDDINFRSYPYKNLLACRQLVNDFREKGAGSLSRVNRMKPESNIANTFVFDEVGREEIPANHFGNKLNVMQDVMANRYDLYCEHGIKTHITTNIVSADDYKKLYGTFIASRMEEMFNEIECDGPNRRKQKKAL